MSFQNNQKPNEFLKKAIQHIVVYYHHMCCDGFGAATVAYKYYRDQQKKKKLPVYQVKYLPMRQRVDDQLQQLKSLVDEYPIKAQRPKIICFDVSVTPTAYQYMKEYFVDFEIHDHHISTIQHFQPNSIPEEYHVDTTYSGCVLAWKYYFPKHPVPKYLQYLQDRDLYTFKLAHSRAINESLFFQIPIEFQQNDISHPNFENWLPLLNPGFFSKQFSELKTVGKILLSKKRKEVNKMTRDHYLNFTKLIFQDSNPAQSPANPLAQPTILHEYNVCWTISNIHRSELGERIMHLHSDKIDFAIILEINAEETGLSFRSSKNFDITQVAEILDGGGHPDAGGFKIKNDEIDLCRTDPTAIIIDYRKARNRLDNANQ